MSRIILGIDPGLAVTGYGVIKQEKGGVHYLAAGVIRTSGKELRKRLSVINEDLRQIIDEYNPDQVAVEQLFFARNSKTALLVGQARGVAITATCGKIAQFREYTPLQVKQALTGYGRAEKKQIQEMVKIILKLEKIPRPVDAADALAIAICDSQRQKI